MQKLCLTLASIIVSTIFSGGQLDDSQHPKGLVTPGMIAPGTSSQVTLNLDIVGSSPTTVTLTSSDPSQLTVPSQVTVPTGSDSVQFRVQAASSASTSATISASANSVRVQSPTILF